MRALLFSLLLVVLFACGDSDPEPGPALPNPESGQTVWVLNEGNFRWGNADLGLINLRTGQSAMNGLKSKNGRSPGDVLQSLSEWNGKWFLVMNNSGIIQEFDPQTLEARSKIEGLTSPRYLLSLDANRAWCSDLYANRIWLLESGKSTPSGSISVPGWTEEMLVSGSFVLAVCRNKPLLLILDPAQNRLVDSLVLPGKATSLAPAGASEVWVGYENAGGSGGGVWRWNPSTRETLQSISLSTGIPDRFSASPTGDSLFFLAGMPHLVQKGQSDVRRILPAQPVQNPYGLAWDPQRRCLWLSDARDYVQNSTILQISPSGDILRTWTGGPITSRFYFN